MAADTAAGDASDPATAGLSPEDGPFDDAAWGPAVTGITGGDAPVGADDRRGARSRADALAESALLHAMRASVYRAEAERAAGTVRFGLPVARLAASRAGHRARFAVLLTRRTLRAVREEGAAGALGRIRARLGGAPAAARPAAVPAAPAAPLAAATGADRAQEAASGAAETVAPPAPLPAVRPGRVDPAAAGKRYRAGLDARYEAPVATPPATLFGARVLIVAELALPQCAKYRVWQKKTLFDSLGIPCTVVAWNDWVEATARLQTHTLLILYRVPAFPDVRKLIGEARRLGLEVIWEVDDLIVDVELYGSNRNLLALPKAEQAVLLDGARLYREAMLLADRTIASTATLARLMAEATGRPSDIVANALDRETLDFAERGRAAAARRPREDDRVAIFYGSGTSTHDADMAVATEALARLMADDARVVFRVMGPLRLGPEFDRFGDRVERLPLAHYRQYLAELAAADIAIAPLEDTVFNDAKSNIKLIEAAIVGLPAVCSPAVEFRDAITDGVDGYLAADTEGWERALRALVADPAHRRAVALAAERNVRARYAPETIAREALAPIVARLPAARRAPLRVLAVNIYYAPRSLGGATVIAEEMARRLDARDDTEVFVFTSHERHSFAPYMLTRYVDRGLGVIGVCLRPGSDEILSFDDPEMGRAFSDALEAVRPDVVHLHSIQHLGAAIPRACQAAGIPYVVTLHDAWWLCPRQFMVRSNNAYCHQTTIDLKVCAPCVPGIGHLQSRMHILMQGLDEASLLLSPSAAHAALYRANGIPDHQLRVNRNGVRPPVVASRPPRAGPLRFAFVGGNNRLKGVEVIRSAFATLGRADWALTVVDASLALGFSSFDARLWRLPGTVEIVPPYEQEEIDEFFAGIDVLLFPSQWKESFGLTVREALIRDVWVIATDSGGAAEEIVPGVNGTLVPMTDDPDPLADAIRAALDDPAAIRAHRNPHRAGIATLDDQARELHAMLREVVNPPASGAEPRPA